jgi:hypothetical protein
MKKLSLFTSGIVAVLICIVFFSCQKNNIADDVIVPPIDNNNLVEKISTSTSGFVTDENNLPVKNADVVVGLKNTTTDKYGYFEIKNVDQIKNAAFVTVNKTGYFKGIKTWIANAGKSSFFRIKLMPKTTAGTLNGATGGDVTLTGGLKISFPANAIMNAATSVTYTGVVSVKAKWLNPLAADLNSIMPGDLRGTDAAGALKLLTTYGMAAVELVGTSGELLQIATGKKATITMPIPATMLGASPSNIPLWYFDEANGLWKEEGAAAKVGNNFVGDVSHFSFWNCDVPNNYVQFNCTVLITNGLPLSQALVKISLVNNPQNSAGGFTDVNGYVSGAVPNSAQLKMEIFLNNNCNTAAFTQTFTTTNIALNYGNITVVNTTNIPIVTGNITNCNGLPVTNGYIILKNGNDFIRHSLSNTGSYNFPYILCGNTSASVNLIGEDIATAQQSNPTVTIINNGVNAIPTIQACGVSVQEFINYTLNGTGYSSSYPTANFNHYNSGIFTTIYGYGQTSSYQNINFNSVNISLGSNQNLTSFRVSEMGNDSSVVAAAPILVNITEYGAVGQYISGNFNGTLLGVQPPNNSYNVNCSFRVKRTF